MSVLKNNGINLGSGDPSSVADGDLKRVGTGLFVRNGGAWQGVGGGGGSVATGILSGGDNNIIFNVNFGFTANSWGAVLVQPRTARAYSGTGGTSASWPNGAWSDSTQTRWMWIAGA